MQKFVDLGYTVLHIVPAGGLGYELPELDAWLDEADRIGLWIMLDMRWSYQVIPVSAPNLSSEQPITYSNSLGAFLTTNKAPPATPPTATAAATTATPPPPPPSSTSPPVSTTTATTKPSMVSRRSRSGPCLKPSGTPNSGSANLLPKSLLQWHCSVSITALKEWSCGPGPLRVRWRMWRVGLRRSWRALVQGFGCGQTAGYFRRRERQVGVWMWRRGLWVRESWSALSMWQGRSLGELRWRCRMVYEQKKFSRWLGVVAAGWLGVAISWSGPEWGL